MKEDPFFSPSCKPDSESLNWTKLEACKQRQGGIYIYDPCKDECIWEHWPYQLSAFPELEELFYGRIFPVLVFFVVVANVLVAMVLSKRHMVTPTNVVLKYMAIADLFVGLTPLPWTLYYFTFGNYQRTDNMNNELCYVQKMSMDALPPIFHNIAMWLTVLLAGQRFISISYPLYSRSLCNVKNVRIATVIITIVSLICGLPKSFDFKIDFMKGYLVTSPSGTLAYREICTSSFTPIVTAIGPTVYFSLYFWTRSLVFILLPCVLLIGLNAGLIRGIQKAKQRKLRLLKEKRTRDAQKQTDTNSTSLMLVVIVSIFLIVNLPQAIFMVVLCIGQTFPGIQFEFMEGRFPIFFLLVNNMLVMATYPVNFGIYCFMSSSFRQTFSAIFCRRWGRPGENSTVITDARRMDNSGIPLVKAIPDEPTINEDSVFASKGTRNDSVFL